MVAAMATSSPLLLWWAAGKVQNITHSRHWDGAELSLFVMGAGGDLRRCRNVVGVLASCDSGV